MCNGFNNTNLVPVSPTKTLSFDNNFQQTYDDEVGPLVMNSSSEMQQMRAGELFKPADLHGSSSYNNNSNNTNRKKNPRTQS